MLLTSFLLQIIIHYCLRFICVSSKKSVNLNSVPNLLSSLFISSVILFYLTKGPMCMFVSFKVSSNKGKLLIWKQEIGSDILFKMIRRTRNAAYTFLLLVTGLLRHTLLVLVVVFTLLDARIPDKALKLVYRK